MTSHDPEQHHSPDYNGKPDEITAIFGQTGNKSDTMGHAFQLISRHSPFLKALIRRHEAFAARMLENDPDRLREALFDDLKAFDPGDTDLAGLSTYLRQKRGELALLTAAADIANLWPLEQITDTLSAFAEKALQIALAAILGHEAKRGNLTVAQSKTRATGTDILSTCGIIILGMGKLGGKELNYSSDIDLIILYDPIKVPYSGRKSLGDFMVRLTKSLVEALELRTQHGYVFRVDLRLRPDPGSTPLAITMSAAETYYQTIAASWERSAMIKARYVAGDEALAGKYLEALQPWIWRRSMDFAAIADIASIKEHLNTHYAQKDKVFEGYNVKLGAGGIREIEFFCQINQLLFGGRHPRLRTRKTLKALDALVQEKLIEEETAETLSNAYIFLRRVEHRIQMINDEQSHTIPEDQDAVDNLGHFLGYDSAAEFERDIRSHTSAVAAIYNDLMPDTPNQSRADFNQNIIQDRFDELGFRSPRDMAILTEKWRRHTYRALRTSRSQSLFEEALPELVRAFSTMNNPDEAMSRFDKFLSNLPAGVQLFALLTSNPSLFALFARIMGLAPALAEVLSRRPNLWELVLEPGFYSPIEPIEFLETHLARQMARARDYQDALDVIRQVVNEYRFRIGVQLIEAIATAEEALEATARLADAALKTLIPVVEHEFEKRYGAFETGGMMVVALGKYGGGELTYISDLDLVLLYDAPDGQKLSNGPKQLVPSQYFSRLGQTIITAISALTPHGRLFEVDTRLRPSGSQGPLVVTMETFRDYYRESAWTWEHMALTRARIIYGREAAKNDLTKEIKAVLTVKRDIPALTNAVLDMRNKLRAASKTDNIWEVKQVDGGLIDVEFICQYLFLTACRAHSDIFSPNIAIGIEKLCEAGFLTAQDARQLREAHAMMQKVQAILRLCLGTKKPTEDDFSKSLKETLCRATGQRNFKALRQTLISEQKKISGLFNSIISA